MPVNAASGNGITIHTSQTPQSTTVTPASTPATATPASTPGSTDMITSAVVAGAPDFVAQATGLDVPISEAEQRYLDGLSPQLRAGLTSIASAMTAELQGGGGLRDGALMGRWSEYLSKAVNEGAVDVNALVQQVLREAYMSVNEDLAFYAQKVKFFNEVKKQIREELTRARDSLAQNAGNRDQDPLAQPFAGKSIYSDFTGGTSVSVNDSVRSLRTVDAVFSSAVFVGERASQGSNVDPVAIQLGDGPAVIDTPSGSFVVGGQWRESPVFTTPYGWPPPGGEPRGLQGVANQMWAEGLAAADKDGNGRVDPSEEQYLPAWWGGGARPEGATEGGTASSRVVWKSADDILNFLVDEVRAGRISIADTALQQFNADPPNYTVGKCHISIQYYEEQRTTTWFGPNMGILVNDANEDGKVDNTELFGDDAMTGHGTADGYEDMARFDVNQDGVLSVADGDAVQHLKVWQDLNSDGKVQQGELKTLAERGVVEMSVTPTSGPTGEAGVILTSSAQVNSLVTKGDLDAYIKAKEEQLNSVGDDAQLANVDLQNILQKQQQTLQMMSNISKMLHDTALAVIRKIGG